MKYADICSRRARIVLLEDRERQEKKRAKQVKHLQRRILSRLNGYQREWYRDA